MAASAFELGFDAIFERVDPFAAWRVEGEVDFCVVANLFDVAFGFFTSAESAENFIFKKHSGVLAIDDCFVTEIGFSVEDQIHFLPDEVARVVFAELAVDPAAGDDAVAFLVNIRRAWRLRRAWAKARMGTDPFYTADGSQLREWSCEWSIKSGE